MYKAHRDYRFEYVWEVMSFIEENQCKTCAFQSDRPEYPMCGPVEYEIMTEQPVEGLDDLGADGVVCRLYRNVDDYTFPDPLQMELFE